MANFTPFRHVNRLSLAVLFSIALVSLVFLYTYRLDEVPPVRPDEAWQSMAARTILQEHRIAYGYIDKRVGFGEAIVMPAIVQPIVLAGFYSVVGLNVYAGRLFSLLSVLTAAVVFYSFLRTRLHKRASLFAAIGALLFLMDSSVFYVARTIRYESLLVLLATLSLFLIGEYLQHNDGCSLLLAGVVSGVGLYTHAVFVVVVIGSTVILVSHRISLRQLMIFLLGATIGLLPYVSYLLYLYVSKGINVVGALLKQMGLTSDLANYTNPLAVDTTKNHGFVLSLLRKELVRYIRYAAFPYRLIPGIAFFLVPLVALVFKNARPWALGFLAQILAMLVLIKPDTPRYLVIFIPLMTLLVWQIGLEVIRPNYLSGKSKVIAIVAFALLAGMYISHAGFIAGYHLKYRDLEYHKLQDDMLSLISSTIGNDENVRVLGPSIFWFCLTEIPWRTENESIDDLARYDPTVLIVPEKSAPWFYSRIRTYWELNKAYYACVGRTQRYFYYGQYAAYRKVDK